MSSVPDDQFVVGELCEFAPRLGSRHVLSSDDFIGGGVDRRGVDVRAHVLEQCLIKNRRPPGRAPRPTGAEVPHHSHRGVRNAQSGAFVGRLRLPDDAHGEIRILILDSGGVAAPPAKLSHTPQEHNL